MGGVAAEELRLVEGGVTATNHNDVLAREEGAVAGGAIADALADELGLAGDAELVVVGACGDDDGAGAVVSGIGGEDEAVAFAAKCGDFGVNEFGAELARLGVERHAEFQAGDAVGEAGEVLDRAGGRDLTTRHEAFKDDVRRRARAA